MFRLGQLVLCTADDADFRLLRKSQPNLMPRKGSVYIVGAVLDKCPSCNGPHIWLEELPFIASGYPGDWFRPCRPYNFEIFMMRLFPDTPERRMVG